jgi:hypothetical protein
MAQDAKGTFPSEKSGGDDARELDDQLTDDLDPNRLRPRAGRKGG